MLASSRGRVPQAEPFVLAERNGRIVGRAFTPAAGTYRQDRRFRADASIGPYEKVLPDGRKNLHG